MAKPWGKRQVPRFSERLQTKHRSTNGVASDAWELWCPCQHLGRYVEVPFAYFLQTCFTHEQVKFRAHLDRAFLLFGALFKGGGSP